jgi:hypothetical protein
MRREAGSQESADEEERPSHLTILAAGAMESTGRAAGGEPGGELEAPREERQHRFAE